MEDESSGGTTGGAAAGCEALCAKQEACDGDLEAGCLEDCELTNDAFEFVGQACLDLWDATVDCMAAATCEELAEDTTCEAEIDATYSEACTIPKCDEFCDVQIKCGELPAEDQLGCAVECSLDLGFALGDVGQECHDARMKYVECFAGLTCEQLAEDSACDAEIGAMMMSCGEF
jgi:hypothetical protein